MSRFIIDDNTNNDILYPTINGEKKGHGYDPDQVDTSRVKSMRATLFGDAPGQLQLIPRSEWDARFDEQEERQSSLSHLFMRMNYGRPGKVLDQNGQGFCWNYSVTQMLMVLRGLSNLPYVELSGHANACLIKDFQDKGGWGAEGALYAEAHGAPSVKYWAEKSMSRSNNTAAMRENALLHRPSEAWADDSKAAYDMNLTEDEVATLCFNNIPYIHDSNDWGHSILGMRWVRVERGLWCPEILNSWTAEWGNHGFATLNGRRRLPDGGLALRVITASVN